MTGKRRSNRIDPVLKRSPPPTTKELRSFGLLMGCFIAGVFGVLFPWLWNRPFAVWPWVVGGLFILWALAAPTTLASVFQGWMIVGGILGWINTRIILALVFYLLFFPLGFVMRRSGWDPLRRAWKRDIISYRIQSKAADRKRMERPF
ncbi:MAG: sxtJ [Candidatus Manganitrophaceae bacterium]|nr:MAG: sxtJ [Candidatus Manganitrophaceae bacterium]